MTLKEKFQNIPSDYLPLSNNQKNECVIIADDFAIGFAKWILTNCWLHDDEYWELVTKNGDIRKSEEELLEIYKKEKGL